MTSVAEVQALLRFLSQDAKVPVPLAMSKVNDLKNSSLITPESLAKVSLPTIQSIFPDEKSAKQILAAAKRVSKKRTSSSASTVPLPKKRVKHLPLEPGEQLSPAAFEASLTLPTLDDTILASEDDSKSAVLYTNRAPLVVAFVVQLLKYTMPSQPLSSRLSLAQAVMSLGAKSKALNMGIQTGKAAEDEGWGEGQPKLKVMGRELRITRRWGYEWQEDGKVEQIETSIKEEAEEKGNIAGATTSVSDSQETIKGDPSCPQLSAQHGEHSLPATSKDTEPPLWGLNLETLRSKSYTSPLLSAASTNTSLPIYDPHSARNYLVKSFATAPCSMNKDPDPHSPLNVKRNRLSPTKEKEEKEHNVALLLHALDMLYASWIDVIGADELDRRAWGWYVRVRPEVENGPAGWGGRGNVRLQDILDLRR
ncbi:MAG: hypothetical protein Q9170_002463 [Blastenia crenularia]